MNHRPAATNLRSYITDTVAIPSVVMGQDRQKSDKGPRVANGVATTGLEGGAVSPVRNSNTSTSGSNNNDARLFPMVLHAMLKTVDAEGLSHIISWQPHGRCVLVHRPTEFVTQIMPRWFKQTKWTSFLRQLNIYGFQRITSGPDKSAYYHPLFLRGKESLALDIPRTQIKGSGPRRPTSTTLEPNFYGMPPLEPYTLHGELDHLKQPEYPTAPLAAAPIPMMTMMHPTNAYRSEPNALDVLMSMSSGHNISTEATQLYQSLLGNVVMASSESYTQSSPSMPLSSGVQQSLLAPTNYSTFDSFSDQHSPNSWRNTVFSENLPELPWEMGPNTVTRAIKLQLLERMTSLQLQKSALAAAMAAATASPAVSMAPMVGTTPTENAAVLGDHSAKLVLHVLAEQLQQGSHRLV